MSCHKEFDPKSAAASWNATSLCLLPSHLATHVVNCACVLHHFMNFWRYRSFCKHEQWWRPLHTLLELLLNIKGPLTWIISKVNSIPMPCSMAYESILSLAQHLRLLCRMMRRYQKHSKKSISTSNFKNLVLIIVLANIWRCNMYVILS